MVKVVETGYPTGLLVEKGNNGKMQYKLDKEQIYYWLKKGQKVAAGGQVNRVCPGLDLLPSHSKRSPGLDLLPSHSKRSQD